MTLARLRLCFRKVASELSTNEIVPPAAGRGGDIDMDPVTGYHDGVVLSPKPFKVEMRLRNKTKRDGLLRGHQRSQEALRAIGV